jgi:hypothetical protein
LFFYILSNKPMSGLSQSVAVPPLGVSAMTKAVGDENKTKRLIRQQTIPCAPVSTRRSRRFGELRQAGVNK